MEVKVSIIIAAYNIEKYIEKCLESVVNQTFKNIEIIVVNDGSTDSTLEQIESFKEIDQRIIIINQKNMGIIEARKAGFKVASGEYVLFIDGDDWLDVKAIETLYKISEKEKYDIIQYGYLIAYEDGRFKNGFNSNVEMEISGHDFLEMLLKGELNINIWPKFIKRNYIVKNNICFPNKISYGDDLAISISLALHEPKVYITNTCLYYYYQRNTSITHIVSEKILEITDVILFIKKILIESGLFERYQKEFEYMAYMHSYYFKKNLIYLYENELSKKIFSNWKKLNISMSNNKYYKKIYEKDTFKAKIMAKICERNYYLGKICYNIIKSYNSAFLLE